MAEYAERYPELKAAGVEMVAISVDDPARSAPMKSELKLPFAVLSDSNRELVVRWGLLNDKEMGGIAYPAVFAIDRDLKVRFRSIDTTAKRADTAEVAKIVRAVAGGSSDGGEAARRNLRPGIMFIRAAANALRRGVKIKWPGPD